MDRGKCIVTNTVCDQENNIASDWLIIQNLHSYDSLTFNDSILLSAL